MTHSRLSPSSASIWVNCPGSIIMTMDCSSIDSPESMDGTAAHEVAAKMIDLYRRTLSPFPIDVVGKTLSNGILATDEMYDAADLYARDVLNIMRKTQVSGGNYLGIEQHLKCPEIHPEMYGTCDCFLYDRRNSELYLWEFKYGHGIIDEYENWQAISYLFGIASLFNIDGIGDQKTIVHFRLVQPRAYHPNGAIREWKFLLSDIRGHINRLCASAKEAMGLSPAVKSGSHCRYCRARHKCASAQEAGISLYEHISTAMPECKLSNAAIGLFYEIVLRALEQIKCLETGIGEEIKSRIKSGAEIPGFIIEPSFGRESWSRPISDIIKFGELMGVNLRKEEAVTPAQARKLGIDETLIKNYTLRQQTGTTIKPFNIQKARRIFS
jgi:hypothetical protein